MITPDSGTSELTFPTWAYKKSIKKFPVIQNCASNKDLGTLTYDNLLLKWFRFVIEGDEYPIPSHHFIDRMEEDDGSIVCKTSISPLDIE